MEISEYIPRCDYNLTLLDQCPKDATHVLDVEIEEGFYEPIFKCDEHKTDEYSIILR